MEHPPAEPAPECGEPSEIAPGLEFGLEYEACVLSIRSALRKLVAAAGGDSTKPQDLSRNFQLDKNLTWKVSRLIHTNDPLFALRFLPGPAGLKILDAGLGEPAGAEPRAAFRASIRDFEAMVERHAGDRATLEMLVQGLDHARSLGAVTEVQGLQRVRREAFRSNAAVWGVQAATQFSTIVIAPNASDRSFADVIEAKGLIDFRRTRSDTCWPLFSRSSYHLDREAPFAARGRSLDGGAGATEQAPLLPNFCSEPLPKVTAQVVGNSTRYELPPGPVGNTNLQTIVYGVHLERIGEVAMDEPGATSEVGAQCNTPAEHLQIDLLLHRGLGWPAPASASLYGLIDGRSAFSVPDRDGRRLPLEAEIEALGVGLERLGSERVSRAAEIAAHLIERGGWQPDDFEAYRISVPHPPMSTALLLSTPIGSDAASRSAAV